MADNYGRGSDGKFLPNNPGKPKGSSKNKLRDKIRTFVDDNFEKLPEWFDQLKPKEKVEAYLNLMPYVVSRLQSINWTDEVELIEKDKTDFSLWSSEDLRILSNLFFKYDPNPSIAEKSGREAEEIMKKYHEKIKTNEA